MGGEIRTHLDLKIWKKAIALVTNVYKITRTFPKDERYALGMQLRKASVSVASNIAEGAARRSTKEFIHFLYIAMGSIAEIETQFEIAKNLGFPLGPEVKEQYDNLRKMLCSLSRALRKKSEGAKI